MRVCLVEDKRVTDLSPLTVTRPAWDLRCGLTSLGEKQCRYFAAVEVGYWCRDYLAEWWRSESRGAPVNDATWLARERTLLVNGRWLPPAGRIRFRWEEGPFVAWQGEDWAYAWLDPEQLDGWLRYENYQERWRQELPAKLAGGRLIRYLWELLEVNSVEIAHDVAEGEYSRWRQEPLPGVVVLGPPEWLYVHPTAEVEPQVVIDTRPGPVVLEASCCVQAFSRVEGPCFIGAGSIVYGAKIRGGTTIGPHCRIGGEVENSIVIGYSNKYHEGFLGHSYVGAWVNLAAGTHTSDLRCDYRCVTVPGGFAEIDTGRRKVGAFLGDHVKTGLGVLLDAGSVLEPFAQVLPMPGFAPRWVPAFQRVGPAGRKLLHDVERLLDTVRIVFQRRDCELTSELERLYRRLAAEAIEAAAHDGPAVIPWRRTA